MLERIDRALVWRRGWRGHRLTGDDMAEHGLGLAFELEHLAFGHFTDIGNRRLA